MAAMSGIGHGYVAALSIFACFVAGSAGADDAMTQANRSAYTYAKRCAVAAGMAADDRHKAGDEAKAAIYGAKSRLSFDDAYALGAKIGLTDKQVARDMDFAQLSELPRMVKDQSYFFSTVATCKALGLM